MLRLILSICFLILTSLGCRLEERSRLDDVALLTPGGDGFLLQREADNVTINQCPKFTSFYNADGSSKSADDLVRICNLNKAQVEVTRFKQNLSQALILSSNTLNADDQSLVEKYKVGADASRFDLMRQQKRDVMLELEPIRTFLAELKAGGIPNPEDNLTVDQRTRMTELESKLAALERSLSGADEYMAAVVEVNNRINALVDSLISSPSLTKDRVFISSRDGQTFFYNILASYVRNQGGGKPSQPAEPPVQQPATPPFEAPSIEDIEIRLSFKLIPRGSFVMGSLFKEQGRQLDEQAHGVNLLDNFELMTHEVTQRLWFDIMGDNPAKFRVSTDCAGEYREINGTSMCPEHPVESVSWDRVQEFINRLNEGSKRYTYRLPSEAEWEHAARGGTNTAYVFGDSAWSLKEYAWFEENSGLSTHRTGALRKTKNDLHDMLGNVWEWTANWYAPHPETEVTNPKGPTTGTHKVIKGCGWSANATACRSASRDYEAPGNSSSVIGFRLVRARK